MRVPGQHLIHHPLIATEASEVDADPMRPYRVHELLTRHAQGKRRGLAGEEAPPPTQSIDSSPESPVPGAAGRVQEDGR
jgi:hypothetical protein